MFLQCQRHQFAVEYTPEPLKPTPPPDQVCPYCIAEKGEDPLHRYTGTHAQADRVISAETPDEDFLRGVRSPLARQRLIELRDAQQREAEAAAVALTQMDNMRPLVIDLDRADTPSDKRKAKRRLMRAARGARW